MIAIFNIMPLSIMSLSMTLDDGILFFKFLLNLLMAIFHFLFKNIKDRSKEVG
jgi:hypothetical protein